MSPLYSLLVSFFLSLLVVSWIHPRLVKIALLKNIVDNPDARKLQRTPVPVLGGVAVFFGIVIGIGSVESAVNSSGLLIVIMAMMAMLYTGTMDDILNLSPALRFLIEILVVLLLIHAGGYCIDDFHGLWGIGRIPRWIAVPLTVVASVGIINAINLIDGVNGLSSGFCILACMMFGTLFYLSGDMKMTLLAVVSVGALIPFFFHNVFGKTSKMFIGDGHHHVDFRHRNIAKRLALRRLRRGEYRADPFRARRPVHSRVRYAARHVNPHPERHVTLSSR